MFVQKATEPPLHGMKYVAKKLILFVYYFNSINILSTNKTNSTVVYGLEKKVNFIGQ